jgi:5-methylthioadenosine/S-adenosylhomocysteine deaminase
VSGKTVVHGATIVTNDERRRVLRDGALVYQDDTILEVGDTESIKKKHPNPEYLLDCKGKVVIPGLIQAHTHVMGHVFKGFTEDGAEEAFYRVCLPMEDYISPDDAYWLSMAGCLEALRFGTTMINDIFHFSDQTARAVEEIGMRAVVEQKVFDVVSLANIADEDYSRDPEKGMRKLRENEQLIKKWHGAANGRIRCWVGNHAPDTNSPELLLAGRELADRYGVGIHIHVAQSRREVSYIKKTYGKTSVSFLNDLGFLRRGVVCAHLAFATSEDIAILERTGAAMAHCPVIMGKFGTFPRISELLRSGVRIGLGSDWVSLNPWDDMRGAIEITRAVTGDVSIQNAARAFEMATVGSADVLEASPSLGSLTPGAKADFVVIDAKRPNLVPMRDVLPTLVYNMTGYEVQHIVCDGRTVLWEGHPTLVDEQKVMAKAQAAAEGVWTKGGVWPPRGQSTQ